MRAREVALISILPIVLLASSGDVSASSGNPIMHLPWQSRTEILEYHSCGMADMCWVAEVKNKKTKKRIATLRCDGEKLFSSIGKHPETVAAENCHRFENENKFQEIPDVMRILLHR